MSQKLILPLILVAEVLKLKTDSLTENSAMGETPNWDSLNHLGIICKMEKSYGITIPNEDIEKYVTMKAIMELYEKINK
jgi:acyl carrier protein